MNAMRHPLAFLIGLLISIGAASARAAPCAGFADVSDASSFCSNVEWLRNRGVTLGCTSAMLFCPGDPVTRLQMAAFLNRLAKAIEPDYRFADQGGSGNLSAPVRVCQTQDYLVSAFPRSAWVQALVNVYASATAQGVYVNLLYSTNGGASWSGVANGQGWHYIDPTLHNEFSVTVFGLPLNLAVGTTYRFAAEVYNYNGPAGFAGIACRLLVRIENRNGAFSPFDAANVAPTPK